MATALVLSGGGSRGAAQVGVLRALAARGFQPDACVGTSVGALNAAVCAARPLPEAVRVLEDIWASPQTRAVLTRSRLDMLANRLRRRPYLRSGTALRDLVRHALRVVGARRFEDLRLPLRILMTDLGAGERVVAASGDLEDALCASAAVPGVFPPVRVGRRLCYDGGITENCGIATAATLDPERIVAIDLTADPPLPGLRRWSEVLERMMQVALHARIEAELDRFQGRVPVTIICPRPTLSLRTPRFADVAAVRDAAFAAADRWLQRIATPEGLLPSGLFYVPVGVPVAAPVGIHAAEV